MICLAINRPGIALLASVLLLVLAGCGLVVPTKNLGDGPAEAVCAEYPDQSRPSWCPGGTLHLEVSGADRPLEFWLLGTGPDGGGTETDLTSHPITDVPPGTYRALVPWVHCTGTCGGAPIGPFRCEGHVAVPAYGVEIVVEVSFEVPEHCTISVTR
jgi:hypothetical protein